MNPGLSPWWHEAACLGSPPDLWDPYDEDAPTYRRHLEKRAKDICNDECPVKAECLSDALQYEAGNHQVRATIRGGLSPRERASLARRKKRAA